MAMGPGAASVVAASGGAREGTARAGVTCAPPSVAGTAVSLKQQQQQHIVAPTAAAAAAASASSATGVSATTAVPGAGAGANAGVSAGNVPGVYSAAERRAKIERYLAKRRRRVWRRNIKYSCRKKLADDRPRFKGRFVKTGTEAESSAPNAVGGVDGGAVPVPVSVTEPVPQMAGSMTDGAAMGLNGMAGGMVSGIGGGMGAEMDFGMY